ncbi:poliovirus receptor homolog [Trematomus bernacchii]|uniref:poliovirus receptor homolog n=1 Tax=Trematomus bernacchii TaxID=40690 RepID=UPI00146A9840|nr:poliovirus receptor homolog [Trematomus bernacchii]XP_033984576.1 poliovirus receptor homolog [Trematomus bernacchii]
MHGVSPAASVFLSVFTLIQSTVEALQVIGGNVTVVQGGTANFPCQLIGATETLNQISWQKKTREKPQNNNFFTILKTGPQFVNGNGDDGRFKFIGDLKAKNGSLQLIGVTLMDEGTYTCIFTLFPSGIHKTEIPLHLLVPPVTILKDDHPILGNEEVSLVTCTAAGSKPPAAISWLTGALVGKVRESTTSTLNANSTTTTISSLLGVPTRELDGQLVKCVVTSAAMKMEETLPFTIQVYFSPMEVTILETSEGSFICEAEANPPANITWSRIELPWPQSAVREGAVLRLKEMTPDLNGLYQCEASNQHGSKQQQLRVYVASGNCTACWVLFSLLFILIVAAVAAAGYFYKSGRIQWSGDRQPVPTNSSPLEEQQV